ncbi:MAG: polymer-forming cytoskeletal protein [Roseibacillus sp.]|nr:polymer-forming cytoskeletal protein [Roseibacillus sp.]
MLGRPKNLLLSCPVCGHEQEEPQFACSTFCRERGCGACFQIENGEAVPITLPAEYPFPLRDQLAQRTEGPGTTRASHLKKEKEAGPPRVQQLEFFSSLSRRGGGTSALPSKARIPHVTTTTGDHPAITRLARLLPKVPRKGHRHIHCLECDFPQSIPEETFSTICLRCTASIPLDNHEISTIHHRRIRTRGNVHIHHEGGINGVSVHCHDLTIEGVFKGSGIDCDGDLTILCDGTITGTVRCRRLIVQGHSKVAFSHPVHARDVIIDGIVRGDIVCAQQLALEQDSILEGDIQATSLSIGEGAHHSGKVGLPQLRERYAKFGELADIADMELPSQDSGGPVDATSEPR